MKQPIKRSRAEANNINTEKTTFSLIVDGNNLLKISLVDHTMNSKGEEYGAVLSFLRMLGTILNKKDFNYCMVCWDGIGSGVLRWKYYEDYNLWVRMIQTGAKFYNIQEVLYDVRTTEEQLNRRGGWSYLKNELKYMREFYNMGFYSWKDLVINSNIRIAARLMPQQLREFVFKRIWNHKNS